ncbi:MAG: MATE family efflux transporter [Planctomycetes bacterium]|nr:MATE family efflux transporter [Planctomycetota bacterium]
MNSQPSTLRSEARVLLALAWPIILTQLSMMSLGVVDLMMVGRYGVDAVAAVALGNICKVGTGMVAMGLVLGIDPFLSQAQGARDTRALALGLQRGIVIALLAAVPVAALWMWVEDFLVLLRQDAAVAAIAHDYVIAQLPSIPLFLIFTAQRQYLQARGILRPALIVALMGNALNVALNWVLIFGHMGCPELGAVGSGIATSIVQCSMPLILWLLMRRGRVCEQAWIPWSRAALDPAALRAILAVGVPIGLHFAAEIWGFHIAGLWAGWLGKHELAANSVVLNLASISFMLPLGVGLATATRVGNLVGLARARDAQVAAWSALGLGAGLMALCAATFLLAGEPLVASYTDDPAVLALAMATLPIAAAFQLFDGLQVVAAGVLRGIGRTTPTALANLLGYYALGLPLGYHLAFARGLGLVGIWWGVACGLAVVAASLVGWVAIRGPATARAIVERPAT